MTPSTVPPAAALLTADEFVAKYENANYELVKGVLKELPMPGCKHGFICMNVAMRIGGFVESHDLGRVATNDSFVKTGPDSIRGADVLFYSYYPGTKVAQ